MECLGARFYSLDGRQRIALVMTWIAACSGQRGIYQETRSNRMRPFDETIKEMKRAGLAYDDEERQKLCATLRRMPGMLRHDCIRAADEIERLAKLLREARQYVSDAGSDEDSETQANSSGLL